MHRTDPFFVDRKPHSNGYLESLHRTYGEPMSALPKRDDAHFKRALEFRQREKTHYGNLEREHRALQTRYQQLAAETAQIHTLMEQLSKEPPKDVEPPADRNTSSNREQVVRETDTTAEEPVPKRVLQRDGVVGGSATEHAAEGPESGGGTECADAPAGDAKSGGEDKE